MGQTDGGQTGQTVRLAYNPGPINAYGALRFAYHPQGGAALADLKANQDDDATGGDPAVRLAVTTAMMGNSKHSGKHRYPHHKEKHDDGALLKPALLVSYVYLDPFLKNRHRYAYRDWVLDSGAFSAHQSGTEIKLQDYIDVCKRMMETDPTLTEVFALDVIGDWKASLANCEESWRQGVPAIPCFHVGEPWDVLKGIAKDYPKIALGGAVGYRAKDEWAGQCFARVWPKRIHGFGFGSEKSVMMYPWHSVDATNWEIGPCKFGRWNAFGGKMSVRGSKQNLRAEVQWYLDLERKARIKWKPQMQKLQDAEGPAVRFGLNGRGQGETNGALGDASTVRLAYGALGRQDAVAHALGDQDAPTVRFATKVSGREGNIQ